MSVIVGPGSSTEGTDAMFLKSLLNSKLLALICLLFLIFVLTACGGGGSGSPQPVREPVGDPCDSSSILEGGVCRSFAVRIDARAPTPFLEDGEPVSLEVVLFKPEAQGRFPTIVFNHGSTGNGSDPSLFDQTFTSKAVAVYFVERGWMVAFPQRRGRGRSDGLYDEGFRPDRGGYSCEQSLALAGADRALDDLDAVTDWLRGLADVDTTRMLVAGTSRGGILSVAHVARRPEVFRGAVNFVGGWLGEGCGDYRSVNRTLFEAGAAFPGPTLWLYGVNDSFYSLEHSRSNFGAFTAQGGIGEFHEFRRSPGLNGHFLVNDPALWAFTLDEFIDGL
jgi:dienelactone hydrolase